jgi:hypothetical protein
MMVGGTDNNQLKGAANKKMTTEMTTAMETATVTATITMPMPTRAHQGQQ